MNGPQPPPPWAADVVGWLAQLEAALTAGTAAGRTQAAAGASAAGASDAGAAGAGAAAQSGGPAAWAPAAAVGHVVGGSGEPCRYCPICRGLAWLRENAPDLLEQVSLTTAVLAGSLRERAAQQAGDARPGGPAAGVAGGKVEAGSPAAAGAGPGAGVPVTDGPAVDGDPAPAADGPARSAPGARPVPARPQSIEVSD